MKDISHLYNILNPAQLAALEEVFLKREQTLEGFKLMRKKYTGIKNRIKAIEKKLVIVMEQEDERRFTSFWIMREVGSIENKYKDIEKAIKDYNQEMKLLHDTLGSPHFWTFKPQEITSTWGSHPVRQLKSRLMSADMYVADALDAMRIAERYFKNVASTFKSHKDSMVRKKQMEERLRNNPQTPFP